MKNSNHPIPICFNICTEIQKFVTSHSYHNDKLNDTIPIYVYIGPFVSRGINKRLTYFSSLSFIFFR